MTCSAIGSFFRRQMAKSSFLTIIAVYPHTLYRLNCIKHCMSKSHSLDFIIHKLYNEWCWKVLRRNLKSALAKIENSTKIDYQSFPAQFTHAIVSMIHDQGDCIF